MGRTRRFRRRAGGCDRPVTAVWEVQFGNRPWRALVPAQHCGHQQGHGGAIRPARDQQQWRRAGVGAIQLGVKAKRRLKGDVVLMGRGEAHHLAITGDAPAQFIRTLYSQATASPLGQSWMSSAAALRIGRVLAAIQDDASLPLTQLAGIAGMSRTAFDRCFSLVIGQSPVAHLNAWRLDLATDLLRKQSRPIGTLASQVGFTSDAAFSRAFKLRYGRSPLQCQRAVIPQVISAACGFGAYAPVDLRRIGRTTDDPPHRRPIAPLMDWGQIGRRCRWCCTAVGAFSGQMPAARSFA